MFRSFLKAIGVLFLIAALGVLAQAWEGIGKTATGERRARMERSPQWHQVTFENPQPIENHFFELFKVSGSDDLSPKAPVPTVVPDFSQPPQNGLRVTWFGHSSTLVELDGTRILTETTRRDEPLSKLFETLSHHPPHRVRGTAIFLTGDPDIAPAALMHNLKHNQVLHEQIIILTVKTLQTPRAPESERVKIEDYLPDVKRVSLTFGFMETPNVVKALTEARKHGLKFDIMKTSFFLSKRTIVPSEKSGMPLWQDHLFIFLARNATNATDFFHIPSGRAVELGNQVMV